MIGGLLRAVCEAHRDGDIVANSRDGAVNPIHPTYQFAAHPFECFRNLLLPFL
jgi:hypothetical protein